MDSEHYLLRKPVGFTYLYLNDHGQFEAWFGEARRFATIKEAIASCPVSNDIQIVHVKIERAANYFSDTLKEHADLIGRLQS